MKKHRDPDSKIKVNPDRLPVHIGIIMDGNGRWAKLRGLSRTQGHKQGLEAAKEIVKAAADIGVQYVTLFTFSTENWKRAADEVGFLMNLIKVHLRSELAFYAENSIRVLHTGHLEQLPPDIAAEIKWIVQETAHFKKTTVVLAINYGGQDEIIRAFRRIQPEMIHKIEAADFGAYLDIPDMPDMDLLIRTGGEKRISNFLLWQSAYAELYFSDLLWPDWTAEQLASAINDYQSRDRRFGNAK